MIIELISDLEGIDPVDMSPPLFSVVDPEALDTLFQTSTDDGPQISGHVQFEYRGYDIRVQDDGEIVVLNR